MYSYTAQKMHKLNDMVEFTGTLGFEKEKSCSLEPKANGDKVSQSGSLRIEA